MRQSSVQGGIQGASRLWCGAVARLCDAREVRSDHETVAYPEQWFYVLWQPRPGPLPNLLPDHWGLLDVDPSPTIAEISGDDDVAVLPEVECLWSVWLEILLNCEMLVPWQVDVVQAFQARAKVRERARQRQRYGVLRENFDRFLTDVMRDVPADLSTASSLVTARDGVGNALCQITVAMWPDRTLVMRFDELDFGGPRASDIELTFDPESVALLQLELAMRTRRVFERADELLDLLRAEHGSGRAALAWMRSVGVRATGSTRARDRAGASLKEG
ncbi:hypothetical protein ACWA7J_05845 [Leptothrix sp. BB-4]